MKRRIMMLVAAAAIATPVALASEAVAGDDDGRKGRQESRGDQGQNRGDDDRRGGWKRDNDRGEERANRNRGDRNARGYDAPRPQAIYRDRYDRPGGQGWRRGGYLPPDFQGQMIQDYPRHRLRPPPRGYAWFQVGDDYLMASQRNGLIFDVID